jgi:hypothetical protein
MAFAKSWWRLRESYQTNSALYILVKPDGPINKDFQQKSAGG